METIDRIKEAEREARQRLEDAGRKAKRSVENAKAAAEEEMDKTLREMESEKASLIKEAEISAERECEALAAEHSKRIADLRAAAEKTAGQAVETIYNHLTAE